jgi:hypothetical protein
MNSKLPRIFLVFILAAWPLIFQGCHKDSSTQAQQKAEAAVDKALDAWVRGGPPDKLTAIRIDDPDWKAGVKLLGFLTSESTPVADNPKRFRCRVSLVVQDRAGKRVDKEVEYNVQLGDTVVIERTARATVGNK